MKIFQIHTQGEVETVCAETNIAALKFYEKLTDMELIDFDEHDFIKEIPKSEWEKKFFYKDACEGEKGTATTFKEFMTPMPLKADLICTTNY